MNLSETRKTVLASTEVVELYGIELDIIDFINSQYQEMLTHPSIERKRELKSNAKYADALLFICRTRQDEVRNSNNRLNHNFRMAAKQILSKADFNKINELAYLPRKKNV